MPTLPPSAATLERNTTTSLSAAGCLATLMDGYLSTQLLYIAAELGVAEILEAGPCSSDEVAAAVGADPAALRRVLRGLAADGVLAEAADGRFRLTPAGDGLREGVPGSMRGAILARGRLYYGAAAGLLGAVRSGGVAFEAAYGESFFTYLAAHPDQTAAFQASMADRSRAEAAAVVAVYGFDGLTRLVDVGGGSGILLAAILAATPGLTGVLFDRPEIIDTATVMLEAAGSTGWFELASGDFFTEIPVGADAYLLSRVLHDWDDAEAARILAVCRQAMPAGARLLLVEAVLPEQAAAAPAAIRMDLHMLVLLHGRERTAAEFERLLATAGFALTRIVPTASPAGIAVIEAVPLPNLSRPIPS